MKGERPTATPAAATVTAAWLPRGLAERYWAQTFRRLDMSILSTGLSSFFFHKLRERPKAFSQQSGETRAYIDRSRWSKGQNKNQFYYDIKHLYWFNM